MGIVLIFSLGIVAVFVLVFLLLRQYSKDRKVGQLPFLMYEAEMQLPGFMINDKYEEVI